MPTLVLVRHGESQWNLENRFTGWVDVPLTDKGQKEARAAGERLKATGIRLDVAYTSALQRAQNTLRIILEVLGQPALPTTKDEALNERHYGDLQGLDKAETAKKFGDDQVKIWRRSYDIAPPNGESLKDTAARTLPYFESKILPELKAGRNVIVAAHGNSLRSIVMHLDKLTKEQVLELNLGTGVPIIYKFDAGLKILSREELAATAPAR
ncbi:MAG: 2,3-bisphosphoglycerate-dependent phosphoglycerate mutase [Candidatus Omnitrophica bacterium]|nr:2,3-bisphosphoglycerate-dependent phosphoglycerate mutase [Candidatus Omnitrophota bacterium]